MAFGRRRLFCVPNRRAKLPIGYRRQKRELSRDLYEELDQTIRDFKKKVVQIATKHKRSKPWVRAQLFGGSKSARFLRATPKTRLYDAYVHHKAKEMNEDRAPGDKYSLAEIKSKISSERISYTKRPAEMQAAWLAEYEAYKVGSTREKRVNRKAEQLDASNTLKRVSTDLDTLYTRTGVRALLVAVRSDVLFALNPFIFCDPTIERFLNVTFGRTPDQLARLLEMWAIHGPEGMASAAPKNAPELKKDVRMLLQSKLDDVIALRYPGQHMQVGMMYGSYEEDIVARHRVRLVGWTFAGGRVTNPGQMTMPDLRALYSALINQKVHWELIPADGDGDGDGAGDDEPGTSAPKRKRKERSDKGKKRGPSAKKAAKASASADAATSRKKKGKAKEPAPDETTSGSSDSDD